MGKDQLIDLVPGLSASDILSDTGANVIDIDPESNAHTNEARTFTL